LSDVTYIADSKNKIAFKISTVIYANRDDILQDEKYEFDETGYPYIQEPGNIYRGMKG
jgi:hypothetical protein